MIEGPLGAEHATQLVHNVVISAKRLDKKKIRLNMDTWLMKEVIKKSRFYIPTVETIRHNFSGSNRVSTLDLNFAFHQFPITKQM